MLSAPAEMLRSAERKKGRPAEAIAGRASSAESQWNSSRVASLAPDQTDRAA
jgi:hypothetical protein